MKHNKILVDIIYCLIMAEDIMIYINCQAEDRDICTSYPDLFFSTSPSLPPV